MGSITGKIKVATAIKEYEGQKQIGIMFEASNTWYNVQGTQEELEVKSHYLKKGAEISYDLTDGIMSNISLLSATSIPDEPTKDWKDDIVNIKGKDYVTYKALLNLAHGRGLQSMEILNSWVSEDMKKAWCIVRAKFKSGLFFDGFGSSTPENTGDMTQNHPVEMSHTRSKARALRDALNIGEVAVEEIKKEGSR